MVPIGKMRTMVRYVQFCSLQMFHKLSCCNYSRFSDLMVSHRTGSFANMSLQLTLQFFLVLITSLTKLTPCHLKWVILLAWRYEGLYHDVSLSCLRCYFKVVFLIPEDIRVNIQKYPKSEFLLDPLSTKKCLIVT